MASHDVVIISCDQLLLQAVRKQRPPLQEFMRKLLYKDLNRANTEKVIVIIQVCSVIVFCFIL